MRIFFFIGLLVMFPVSLSLNGSRLYWYGIDVDNHLKSSNLFCSYPNGSFPYESSPIDRTFVLKLLVEIMDSDLGQQRWFLALLFCCSRGIKFSSVVLPSVFSLYFSGMVEGSSVKWIVPFSSTHLYKFQRCTLQPN